MNRELENSMNQFLADCLVLYAKLHNFHWNAKGHDFFQVHEKTEELYDHFATVYDDMAERILQLGGTPLATMAQSLQRAKVQEDDRTSFDSATIYAALRDDFRTLRHSLLEMSSQEGLDPITGAFFDDEATFLEKQLWMLESALARA